MDKYFIEEFSYIEIGYEFLDFKGVKNIISNNYKVEFSIFKNFSNIEISYKIYIPYSELEEHTGEPPNIFLYDINLICDYIAEIRAEAENDITKYLKDNNLIIEVNYY